MNTRFLLADQILEDLIAEVPPDTADGIRDILDETERLVMGLDAGDPFPNRAEAAEPYADVLAGALRRVARSLEATQSVH